MLICWRVLTGQLPQRIEHRSWNRQREAPIVVNVHDFSTTTLLFSVLIWPPLDVSANTPAEADAYQLERAEAVMACITKGAGGLGWNLLYEREERLHWDKRRAVWVTQDGHGFEYPRRSQEEMGGMT
jgi:hypothetical protein